MTDYALTIDGTPISLGVFSVQVSTTTNIIHIPAIEPTDDPETINFGQPFRTWTITGSLINSDGSSIDTTFLSPILSALMYNKQCELTTRFGAPGNFVYCTVNAFNYDDIAGNVSKITYMLQLIEGKRIA